MRLLKQHHADFLFFNFYFWRSKWKPCGGNLSDICTSFGHLPLYALKKHCLARQTFPAATVTTVLIDPICTWRDSDHQGHRSQVHAEQEVSTASGGRATTRDKDPTFTDSWKRRVENSSSTQQHKEQYCSTRNWRSYISKM